MPEPERQPDTNTDLIDEQPPREISQTDHINKKLLTSLFKRMDEGGDSTLAKMMVSDNKTDEDKEWE